MSDRVMTAEQRRLDEDRQGLNNWHLWGPYLTERQWGTVREDYSPGGTPWDYLPHDHARSRAYRWGEDGLAGICDDGQHLCLALALWNGRDPILKERLFGLTNSEGNHGEDVKEYYYYLDATPTHSFLKYLYKYPQCEFPYTRLVEENRRRGKLDPEFELLDTGVFDEDRYFDVVVEYAKAAPSDLVMRVTAYNRGPAAAEIHILPQLWYRNDWTWRTGATKPAIRRLDDRTLRAEHNELGTYTFRASEQAEIHFCENETNVARLFGVDASGPFKDGFHDYIIRDAKDVVGRAGVGTKAAFHRRLNLSSGGMVSLDFVLGGSSEPIRVEAVLQKRREEADEFYAELQREIADPDARLVQRQALAGMIWSKQFFYLRHPPMARRRSRPAGAPTRTSHGSQCRLAAPQQRRCSGDAR
jgi:hypothetical protein